MFKKSVAVTTLFLFCSLGAAVEFESVFNGDAEITFEGVVSPGQVNGISQITVNKGHVVLNGGCIDFTKYMEITVAEGSTLTVHSKVTGGKARVAEIDFPSREGAERWPEAISGIAKKGLGTLVLAGGNTYQGFTLVYDGTLEIKTPDSVSRPLIGGNVSRIILDFPVTQAFLEGHFTANVCGDLQLLLTQDCAEDLDLSEIPGLANATLGALGKVTYSGTLTPARGAYRLGGDGGRLTLTKPIAGKALFVSDGKIVLPHESQLTSVTFKNATLKMGSRKVIAAPTSLIAEGTHDARIKLSWFDQAIDEDAYVLQTSDDGRHWQGFKSFAANTTETVFDAPKHKVTHYHVYAKRGDIHSTGSNRIEVDTRTEALTAPDIVDITAGYKWLDVKWESDNHNIAGYVVSHSTDGHHFKEITRVLGEDRRRAHIYMPKTQKNYLKVAAIDYSGSPGPWSTAESAMTNKDADVQADLIKRFELLSPGRKFNPEAPASLPNYSEAQKELQRKAGASLVKDIEARLKDGTTYTIPAGVYRVARGVFIEGKKNFTIHAPNTRFFWEGGKSAPLFKFRKCESGTVAGPMILQYEVPHFAVAKVHAVDPEAKTIDAKVLPGYSTEFDKAPFRSWFPVTQDGHQGARAKFNRVENLGARNIRMHYGYVLGHSPQVGGYIALNSNVPYVWPVDGDSRENASRNMTYKDITGYGTMTQHYHEAEGGTVRFINIRILPQPGTSQVACGQPGQFFMNRTGTMIVDGCEYNTAWDDGINLCATSGIVSAQDAGNVVYLHRLSRQVRPGDVLSFYDFNKLTYRGRARVKQVEILEDPDVINAGNLWFKSRAGKHSYHIEAAKVTLDRAIGNVILAQVFNDSLGAKDIIVRNTYWRDMMPDAIMMQSAQRGLIANNLFFHNVGPAVQTQMNQFWLEGKWSNNMMIINNVSWENAPVWRRYSSRRAAFSFHASPDNPSIPLISNYVLDGNRSYNNAWPGIYTANLNGALITRNLIVNPCMGLRRPDPKLFDTQDNADQANTMRSIPEDAAAIGLHGGRHITLKDNTILFDKTLAPCTKGIYIGEGVDQGTFVNKNNRVSIVDKTPVRPDFGK